MTKCTGPRSKPCHIAPGPWFGIVPSKRALYSAKSSKDSWFPGQTW